MRNFKLIGTRKKCLARDTQNRLRWVDIKIGSHSDRLRPRRIGVIKMRILFNHRDILNDNDSHLQELNETKCKLSAIAIRMHSRLGWSRHTRDDGRYIEFKHLEIGVCVGTWGG